MNSLKKIELDSDIEKDKDDKNILFGIVIGHLYVQKNDNEKIVLVERIIIYENEINIDIKYVNTYTHTYLSLKEFRDIYKIL